MTPHHHDQKLQKHKFFLICCTYQHTLVRKVLKKAYSNLKLKFLVNKGLGTFYIYQNGLTAGVYYNG